MQKRLHLRLDANNLSVDIADGYGFFAGVVTDISEFGLLMSDLPTKLNETAENMTIIVRNQEKCFKMNIIPKWSNQDGLRKFVGAEILEPPLEWTEFVIGYHSELMKNVAWGEGTIY